MKIEFGDDGIKLITEDILELLYLERLGLEHEGDVAKCVVFYEGSYIALKIVKAESEVEENRLQRLAEAEHKRGYKLGFVEGEREGYQTGMSEEGE